MSRKPYPDDKPLGKPYRSAEDVPSLHQVVVDHFKRRPVEMTAEDCAEFLDRVDNPRPVTPEMKEMVREFGKYLKNP